MNQAKSRRDFLKISSSAIAATLLLQNCSQEERANSLETTISQENRPQGTKIPVILDTDIGSDIDDAWALALLLKSPELDLKMLLTETGNPKFRGAIAGKYLEAAGRTDVPIGLGIYEHEGTGAQEAWLGNYKVSDYPGQVYENGVEAMIEMIMTSTEPITLICIGPVPNIQAALKMEPRIAKKARIVGMFGSLRYGYSRTGNIDKETNVRLNPDACRKMFRKFDDITITPLDTCGIVKLKEEKYQKVRNCQDPLIQTLIESNDSWAKHVEWIKVDPNVVTSTLYDTVAIYLALSEEYLLIENLGIRVTDEGYTLIDNKKKKIRCATEWKDLAAFENWLVNRLTSNCVK